MSFKPIPPTLTGSLNLQSLNVNKLKVDSTLLGNYSSWKLPVVVISSSNITLSGEQTIGSTNVISGDRVLVNGQTNSIDNGIYIASNGIWYRSADLPDGSIASGSLVAVSGTTDIYICSTSINNSIVGTDPIIFEAGSNTLPPALQSIADLNTVANQMLYTVNTNNYDVTSITSAGRSFLGAATITEQQSLLSLVPGVNIQEHSSILDNIVSAASVSDRLLYSTGSNYSTTVVTSFIRDNVLNAADSNTLATNLGYVIGDTITTNNAVVRVTGTNEITETNIYIDPTDNMSGINDLEVLGNITLTGNLDGITPTERLQLANINSVTISNTQWNYLGTLDQSLSTTDLPTFSGIDLNNNKIINLLNPTNNQDAATKNYVDTVASSGTAPLEKVELATSTILPNTPIYASPGETLTSVGGPGTLAIDGVTVSVGNRLLIKNQVTNTENGIYIVTDDGSSPGPNWVLTRSSDFNQAAMPKPSGTSVFVNINGSAVTNSGSTWSLQSTVTTVDPLTDPVIWIQIGGQQTYSAGNGINATSLTGGTIATDITPRLKYTTGSLDLNTIDVSYGGTGNTTLASNGVLIGQGTSPVDDSKSAPTGDFVGTSDTQILTNKTITNSSNNVISRELWVDSGSSSVSTYASGIPSLGQILTATSSTTATWQTPSVASFEPDRTLFVYQSATNVSPNWTSVASAITDASTLTPTSANPVLIIIYPGTYSESTPLVIPSYVTIVSAGSTRGVATIRPTAPAPSSEVITLNGNSFIVGLYIDGHDGAGGYATIGINSIIGTAYSIDLVNTVTVRNCSDSCFKVTGNGLQYSKILICKNTSAQITVGSPFICDNGYKIETGGLLSGNDMNSSGFLSGGAIMNYGLYIEDAYSFCDVTNIQISSCNYGLSVGGGTVPSTSISTYPFCRLSQVRLGLIALIAVEMLAKSNLNLINASLDNDSGIYPTRIDFKNTNPALPNNPNEILAENVAFEYHRLSLVNGATNNPISVLGQIISTEYAEPQFITIGKLVVGTAINGYEFIAGEGNSHVLAMISFIDDGGVFTNITSQIDFPEVDPISCNIATTTTIDLTSAPATVDGITPTSGVSRILVKNGSTANPGTTSVDNGIYIWNGTGAAMTRASDFAAGSIFSHYTFFIISTGTVNYGSIWKIDASTFAGSSITVGTTAFGLQAYSSKIFPDPPANNDAWYIGSYYPLKFPGLKLDVTAALNVSSGTGRDSLIWEFWNGTTWTTLYTMSTKASAPYTNYHSQPFGYGDPDVGNPNPVNYQVRFGEMTNWSTTTVNGVNGYWIRVRVINAAIISRVPVLSRSKLHTNRTKINGDGFMEYFGAARSYDKMSVFSLVQPGIGSGLINPSNNRMVSLNSGGIVISQQRLDLQFRSLGTTASSFVFEVPPNMCTSCLLKAKPTISCDNSAAGNVRIGIYYTYTNTNDVIGNPSGTTTATSNTSLTTLAVSGSRTQISTVLDLNLTNISSGSLIWIEFVRLGSDVNDTYTGNIYLLNLTFGYRIWCNGQYQFL